MLAKAVSSQMGSTFFNITASTIVSKWRGDSEKIVKVLFDLARYYQPSTIFLDEIDSIMSSRTGRDEHEGSRRMKTELLIQLDGLSKKENERVFLLAASNLPWDLDQALIRRLEKRIYIGLPNQENRINLLKKYIPETNHNNIELDNVSAKLEGYSGSDIFSVCKDVKWKVIRNNITKLEEIEKGKKISNNPNKQNIINLNYNNQDCNKDKILKAQENLLILNINTEDLVETISRVKPTSIHSEEAYIKWSQSHGSN